MILVDTSAWVEYVRGPDSATCNLVDQVVGESFATCDAVRMEVLAGARSERQVDDLRRLVGRSEVIPIDPTDYDMAADIYRDCRRSGITPRSRIDCLIAAVAIRAGLPVLHANRDFAAIARVSGLETITG